MRRAQDREERGVKLVAYKLTEGESVLFVAEMHQIRARTAQAWQGGYPSLTF